MVWVPTCAGYRDSSESGVQAPRLEQTRNRRSSISPSSVLIAGLAFLAAANSQVRAQDLARHQESEGGSTATVVAARGRIEPKQRVLRVSGSAQAVTLISVVRELYVDEGADVVAGQVLGVFDTYASRQAALARLEAELDFAEIQLRRFEQLRRAKVVSAAEYDERRTQVAIARARVQEAEAELELSRIRAPVSGRVLKVHAYPGERVTSDGVLELGNTGEMYAVAEVFEDDVARVHPGQSAVITSPVLRTPLRGVVERVGAKIGKLDVLADDPAAKTDARVVEVRIRLEESEPVSALTNLRVDVQIHAASPGPPTAANR